jgi:8-oxo-dGTP pyrophosphatase MutT (NUDIX family)
MEATSLLPCAVADTAAVAYDQIRRAQPPTRAFFHATTGLEVVIDGIVDDVLHALSFQDFDNRLCDFHLARTFAGNKDRRQYLAPRLKIFCYSEAPTPMHYPCDEAFKAKVEEHLAAFEPLPAQASGTQAAVALPIVELGHGADLAGLAQHAEWQTDAALLLTRRSSKLRNHPGQWALPGGRTEPGESPEQAALREMHEEVGIAPSTVAIIGRLDVFVTRSGFTITPVVVWIGAGDDLTLDPFEVDSVHRIPVREFLRDDAPLLDHDEGETHPVLRMPVGDTWIAAPTAALLYQFREVCMLGRPTRVAHYEQPSFAWR